jgi:hypothetical protein
MIGRPPKADPKQRSLEQSGTANPHAQDVRDPAFVDSDFFDPRDLIQVKYEVLRRCTFGDCASLGRYRGAECCERLKRHFAYLSGLRGELENPDRHRHRRTTISRIACGTMTKR